MKKFKQAFIALLVVLMVFGLVGCKKDKGLTKVGILQLVTHDALDKARIGFIEGLKEEGFEDGKNIEIIVKNPEGDTQTLINYATQLIRDCDVVLGIATPAAVQLQTAREVEQKDCKILFTAVTDPVSAGLVSANDVTTDNITGTHDMNPVAEQIGLISTIKPSVSKIGVVYNVSEVNSKVQYELAEEECGKRGITIARQTVSEAIGISAAVTSLIDNGAEAIYLPTDNLIASNMPTIANVCEERNVLTVCGESGMVTNGGCITYSISYKSLGKVTGLQAAKILKGVSVSEIHVTSVDNSGLELVINEEAFRNIELEIPQSIKDRANQ